MNTFPERLKLRATGLHDDRGGLGQAIFTTAGQGYARQEYVRADVVDAIATREAALAMWIENVATDRQLDAPVPCLDGQTGRELLKVGPETEARVAKRKALRELVTEMADELEAKAAARYRECDRGHQSAARAYRREMAFVERFRALAAETPVEGHHG